MNITPLAKEKRIKINDVEISYGLENTGINDEPPSDKLTMIYSATPAMLIVKGVELLISPRSVTALRPGIEAKLYSTPQEEELRTVVFRVPKSIPELTAEQQKILSKPYQVDRREWNSGISEYFDGEVILYPEYSRHVAQLLKIGKNARSPWYTTAYKDQPFSISDAVWIKPRPFEIAHAHKVLSETYIILDGTAHMRLNNDLIPIPKGNLATIDLGDIHKVESVELGNSGNYYHICTQYPSIIGDENERIVYEDKQGFSAKG